MRKLRPVIGDVWKYSDYPPTTLATYLDGTWWGDRPDRVTGVVERFRADTEEVMLTDARWVLVRPAGCPEGLVRCVNRCVRWTKKYAHERGDWCFICLGITTREARAQDWTPPAERRIVEPAVTPVVPTSKPGHTQGRICAEADEWALPNGNKEGAFRLVPESAYEARRKQGSSARPEYMATVYNKQDAERLVRLWNDGLDRVVGKPAVSPPPLTHPVGCPAGFAPCERGCGRWTQIMGVGPRARWCYRCCGFAEWTPLVALDWTPPAAVSPPPAITGDISVPSASDRLAARLKEAEDSLGAFQRVQCAVNDSVMVSVKDIDRRLEALEAPPPPPPPPKPQPCWAVGPGNSRCLRDRHGDDGHHRFGLTLVRS